MAGLSSRWGHPGFGVMLREHALVALEVWDAPLSNTRWTSMSVGMSRSRSWRNSMKVTELIRAMLFAVTVPLWRSRAASSDAVP